MNKPKPTPNPLICANEQFQLCTDESYPGHVVLSVADVPFKAGWGVPDLPEGVSVWVPIQVMAACCHYWMPKRRRYLYEQACPEVKHQLVFWEAGPRFWKITLRTGWALHREFRKGCLWSATNFEVAIPAPSFDEICREFIKSHAAKQTDEHDESDPNE